MVGELCFYVECTYRVYFVAEKVEAQRQLGRIGIDIEDRAAYRVLPRLVYIVNLFEAVVAQPVRKLGHVYFFALYDVPGMAVELVFRSHSLGKRLREGDHIVGLRGGDTAQCFGAQYLVGGIGLAVFDVAFEPRG